MSETSSEEQEWETEDIEFIEFSDTPYVDSEDEFIPPPSESSEEDTDWENDSEDFIES
jgi:hypothetical protein